jgi:hypothetical protein
LADFGLGNRKRKVAISPKTERMAEAQRSHSRGRALRELSPCPLGSPPYKSASPEDDHAQTNPSKYADADEPRTKRHHGCDHGKIIRSGVAAVCAITLPRIQNARGAHPDEGDDPDHGASRYRNKQTGKSGCFRHPPRQQAGVHTPQASRARFGSARWSSPVTHSRRQHPVRRSVLPELADTAPSRRSRTRSNRPTWALALCHSLCIHRKTDRHRSA